MAFRRSILAFVALFGVIGFVDGARAADTPAHSAAFELPATAPGELDVSFSGDGKQTTDFGGADAAAAVAVQADGKIVVAGSSGGNFALARYDADGAPDLTFSGDGLVTTDLGGTDAGQGVAIQADGRIVVAGSSGGNFALARYSAAGVLDTSRTTDFGAADGGTAVAIQADGRIVISGTSGGDFALARYDAQGALDTSFSGDGKQTTDFGGLDSSNDVAIRADGAIVVVGTHAFWDFRAANFAVARYSAGGVLDPSFSGDGKLTTDFGHSQSTYDSGEGVAIQADGRIVVTGYGAEQSQFGGYFTRDVQLARYDASGALDLTFDDDGRLATRFGNADTLGYGVVLEGNGRIAAIGKAGGAFALARFNTDGTLDGTFSDDGKQTTDAAFARGDEVGVDVVLQADGKLVAVGTAGTDFVLTRLHGDPPDPNPPGPNTPDTQISGGPSGPTNVTAPSYRFTSTLAGSTFECKLDGPGTATGTYTSCAPPKAYGPLTDGRYTFSVRATRAGITDPTPATRPFTVDTVAPGLEWVEVPRQHTNNPFARLEWRVTEPDSTFTCRFDQYYIEPFEVGPCVSPKIYGPLNHGSEYWVFVFVTDPAGNESGYWFSGWWTVDQQAPSVVITSGPSDITHATTATFEFNADEEATFECKLDGPGTATGTYASCSSPRTYSGLGAGSYTFSTRATDLAGNGSSPDTRSFTVATNVAPTARFDYACTGLVCYLYAFASSDPDGTIAGYAWEFGDGTTAEGNYVRKVFAQYGTYEARLRVTDNAGAADTRAATFTLLRATGQGSMVGGLPRVSLAWNGTPGALYWIHRASKRIGAMIGTTLLDQPPVSASGAYSYWVCEAAGRICSATETVKVP